MEPTKMKKIKRILFKMLFVVEVDRTYHTFLLRFLLFTGDNSQTVTKIKDFSLLVPEQPHI